MGWLGDQQQALPSSSISPLPLLQWEAEPPSTSHQVAAPLSPAPCPSAAPQAAGVQGWYPSSLLFCRGWPGWG